MSPVKRAPKSLILHNVAAELDKLADTLAERIDRIEDAAFEEEAELLGKWRLQLRRGARQQRGLAERFEAKERGEGVKP